MARELRNFRNGLIAVGILSAGFGGGITISNFMAQEDYWAWRQRSNIVRTLTQFCFNPELVIIHEDLYDHSGYGQDSAISARLRDVLNLSDEEADKYCEVYKNFYKVLRQNFSSVSMKDICRPMSPRYLRAFEELDKAGRNVLALSSSGEMLPKENIQRAAKVYIIEGCSNRFMSEVCVGGYVFERPAYEFLSQWAASSFYPLRAVSFIYGTSLEGLSLTKSVSKDFFLDVAKKADIDKDCKVTVLESLIYTERPTTTFKD